MAERNRQVWTYRALFVALVSVVCFVQLLPISPGPGGIPGPDVVLLIALSWLVMRPDYVPILLLAGVFLVVDLILMRPPGLWTALTILAGEFLRGRQVQLRNASFLLEWLIIAALMVVMTVVNSGILFIFAVDQPSLGLTIIRLIFTILSYPVVVVLAGRAFGLRKVRLADQDRFGQHV